MGMNIWQFSAQVSARLLRWATASTLVGLALLPARAFWRGVGAQAVGWGVIDAAIALVGGVMGQRSRSRLADPHAPDVLAREARNLRRLLWINAGLDVLYMLGGWLWARRKRDAFGKGTGWGIVVQGAFLFGFDLYHALRVPRDGQGRAAFRLDAFDGDAHQPFHNEGGRPAALLIHGFPGSPAEMRPLADALHADGWTVKGVLLPGFGPDIATLQERSAAQWKDAVCAAVTALQREHRPVILVGNSLGGALAVAAAADTQADGLILINPLSRLQHPLWQALPLLKWYLPSFNPFRLVPVDFDDPEVRRGAAQFMPGADFDDPAVRDGMRQLSISTALLDEVRRTGARGEQAAAAVRAPVLVLQGRDDTLVTPESTQALVRRFGGPVEWVEVDGEHNLLKPEGTAWDVLLAAVRRFTAQWAGE